MDMEKICLICRRRGCYKHKQILDDLYQKMNRFSQVNKEFEGSSVTPFIGSYGYPKLNVGLLSPPQVVDDAWRMDAPGYWYQMKYGIENVLSQRSNLMNSRKSVSVNRVHDSFMDIAQEIAMAKQEVDTEFNLKKAPSSSINRGGRLAPIMSSANVEKARPVENVSVARQVDKVVSDEMKATKGVMQLYEQGIDVNQITKLLSVGLLGMKTQRKIVPTRFSITATDDIVGKQMIEDVKRYPELNQFAVFEETYVGNHYLVVMMPGEYSYELMEAKMPDSTFKMYNTQFHQDYEDYFGRQQYAESTAGAFYAGRLAALEYLRRKGKQASILIVREILPEYFFPVGIWQMREAVRGAVDTKPETFNTLKEVLTALNGKMRISVDDVVINSQLLGRRRSQRRLTSFV